MLEQNICFKNLILVCAWPRPRPLHSSLVWFNGTSLRFIRSRQSGTLSWMKCDFLSPTIQRCRDSSHESGERSVRGIGDQSHDRNTSSKYLSSLCVVTRGIMNDIQDDHGTEHWAVQGLDECWYQAVAQGPGPVCVASGVWSHGANIRHMRWPVLRGERGDQPGMWRDGISDVSYRASWAASTPLIIPGVTKFGSFKHLQLEMKSSKAQILLKHS